jgi:glycosyltransferase involved in cell wall biosynthesis
MDESNIMDWKDMDYDLGRGRPLRSQCKRSAHPPCGKMRDPHRPAKPSTIPRTPMTVANVPPPVSAEPSGRQSLCVVVPVYNEAEGIVEFHQRLASVFDALPMDCSVVYINDGSHDRSLALLLELALSDARVTALNLSRNFGKETALSAGLDHAEADAVVVMDADLQHPPEILPAMLAEWRRGFEVVLMRRTNREEEVWFKKTTAKLFYRLLRSISDLEIPENVGDFRLMSRKALHAVRAFPERTRFMKGLLAWPGFRQSVLEYYHDLRLAGATKWNYWRLWNLALEGITSFSTAPLKASSYIGFATAASAFIYAAVILTRTLLWGDEVRGFPTLIVVILFLGGMQLMVLGIIGEYVARMFIEVKQRPLYLLEGVYRRSADGGPVRDVAAGRLNPRLP